MKKILFVLLFCISASVLGAQVWRLVPVFSDDMSLTYLSFGYPDEGEGSLFFTLWGIKCYDGDNYAAPFEVEYFRGSPQEARDFLRGVRDFSRKYSSEPAVTDLRGVKVKSFRHPVMEIYTAVYDSSGRDFCMFKARRWETVYGDFEAFCKGNGIELGE